MTHRDKEKSDAVVASMSNYERSVCNKVMYAHNNYMQEFGKYERITGEVEARNASIRADMSVQERMSKPLNATEDYKRSEQIRSPK